jgi:hypothetical protein
MKSKSSTTKAGGNLPPPLDKDLARWCSVLAEVTAPVETVPPGWFTAKAIEAARGWSEQKTRAKINALLKSGQAESRMFRVQTGKVVRPTPHYRLK